MVRNLGNIFSAKNKISRNRRRGVRLSLKVFQIAGHNLLVNSKTNLVG